MSHLGDRVKIAVPKKGRLAAATRELLAASDIDFHRSERTDIALVKNFPIALIFLPAADIPLYVGESNVALGITGTDQVAEYEAGTPPTDTTGVLEVMSLNWGKCKLQVQTPTNSDYNEPKSLIGKTIATSFTNLTEQYFRKLEADNGMTEQGGKLKTRILHLGGSVEAACSMGMSDGIVDLVESGETMRAAGLRAIDTVFQSGAALIKSKHASNPELCDLIVSRIEGVTTAHAYVLCAYNIPGAKLEEAKKITPGKRAPTVANMQDSDWVAVQAMIFKNQVGVTMDKLAGIGAEDILITEIMNSRNA